MENKIPASTPVVMLSVEQFRLVLAESLAACFDGNLASKQMIHGVPALSKALGISLSGTKKLVASGTIPFMKISTRKTVFDLDAVLGALQKGRKEE